MYTSRHASPPTPNATQLSIINDPSQAGRHRSRTTTSGFRPLTKREVEYQYSTVYTQRGKPRNARVDVLIGQKLLR